MKKRFSPAVVVIIIFGIISMLGDAVYESARSANSQYLHLLDVSAAQVGLVFGLGEFLGYFLRLVAGILSDRGGRHWLFMFIGYGMLVVVPVMGFTREWPLLVVLILMERIGKALRNPAKDTIVSGVAEDQVGVGFAFGLQEALDQMGAFVGPLIFTAVFYLTGMSDVAAYQLGYRTLLIPFILLMVFLYFAYRRITDNKLLERVEPKEVQQETLSPVFWLYTGFTFFCTLGFVNFSTIGYHMKANDLFTDAVITSVYAGAMLVDAGAALWVGRTYDRLKERTGKKSGGILVLALIPFLSLLLPVLALSNSPVLVVLGMVTFGVILGAHETVMRSAIADLTPFHKRGTGYGIFNTAYGLALLDGAALMGWLYDLEQVWLIVVFTVVVEVVAVGLYRRMRRMIGGTDNKIEL